MKILVICHKADTLLKYRWDMISAFNNSGHEVVCLGPDRDEVVTERLSQEGIEYLQYYLNRTGTNVFEDIKSYLSLKKRIKSVNPNVVFAYAIKPVVYGSMAAYSVGVRNIYVMITGFGSAFGTSESAKGKFLNWITTPLYKRALKKVRGVIFQNPDDLNYFIDHKLCSRKQAHRVHGSGVNLNQFYKSDPVLNPVKFLFIGRLLKEKGLLEFIEASKIVTQLYPDVEFHVVGGIDSNHTSVTEEEVFAWESKGLIAYHGEVQDVRPFIEDSSVFVLPSYREGTPKTGLETMAMCRPLVMSDVPGCRETVRDGVNGFLVEAKNSAALAEALIRFIETPKLITSMGKRSREIAERYYDVDKVNRDIMTILNLNNE